MKDISLIVYGSDASGIRGKASKVFFPESIEEVRRIVKENSRLTIRSGGSGLAGGAVPQNEPVIDLSKMNKIISFDFKNNIVEVESGLILDELNEFLDKYNLEFPVKPGSHSIATIGGMIATNAAGERAVKYGKTEKWVENFEVVDGNGEVLAVKKYNMQDFIGLEGITGIIVKAKLRVIEKKKRTADLIALDSIKEVVESVEKYSMLKDISEVEFLDKLTSSLVGLPEKYHLIIEFEDPRGTLKDEEYNKLMEKRDAVYPSLASAGFVRIEDPKISINRFEEFSSMLESFKVPYYGHLGVGIIHPVFRADEQDKIKRVLSFVKKIKGKVSGEHGIGLSKREFLEDAEKKIILVVKKRYDPCCKLNYGKVVGDTKIELSSAEERRKGELDKIQKAIDIQNQENTKDES